MADRVVRLKDISHIECGTREDTIVLSFTGTEGGRVVRAEIALHAYACHDVPYKMREAAKVQADKWTRLVATLEGKL